MKSHETSVISSAVSFLPLIRLWEQRAKEGREGQRQLFEDLLTKIKQHPELLQPIHDISILDKHKALIEQMMATLFPVTLSDKDDLFGAGIPFQYKMFYASEKFRQAFLNGDATCSEVHIPEIDNAQSQDEDMLTCLYEFILDKLYNNAGTEHTVVTAVHSHKCPETGLDLYMEVELDTRFIDLKVKGELPEIPAQYTDACPRLTSMSSVMELQQLLPLELFEIEGLALLRIKQVTERETLNNIRNSLLNIHSFSDAEVFNELQRQVQNLLGLPGVQTAVKPFFRVNKHLVLSEVFTTTMDQKANYKPTPEKLQYIYKAVTHAFRDTERPLLIPEINEEAVMRYPFLILMAELGWRSGIVCPLFSDRHDMLGVLIIVSDTKNKFGAEHMARIEPAIPLFKLALEKSQQNLDHQVDRVIKDQFTAVQDAVEWRFTEAALNYLTRKNKGEEEAKIEPIVFEGVYPLYGAIDIRNSSVERNHSIQLDLLEQLNMAKDIITMAKLESQFPLLDENIYRIDKYIHSVSNILFADEEISILQFLKVELVKLFKHLQAILPSLNAPITKYFSAVDSPVEMVYHHRKKYEDSITIINNEVARFIDQEQQAAQKIFPHYFERFVTDGVDFNIYIGQAISPTLPFDFFYLKNLKIWQLSTLAKAARLTNQLQQKLPMPLQTSQLILAHSHPISISFRTAERKFDVDGAYNIRYEIIKKRIDKVHVKDSNERLTKAGTLAIVYSQPQEAQEYLEYIEFLQNQGLLKGEVEKFELEELQGVSGLKGLRVAVNLEEDTPATQKERISTRAKA